MTTSYWQYTYKYADSPLFCFVPSPVFSRQGSAGRNDKTTGKSQRTVYHQTASNVPTASKSGLLNDMVRISFFSMTRDKHLSSQSGPWWWSLVSNRYYGIRRSATWDPTPMLCLCILRVSVCRVYSTHITIIQYGGRRSHIYIHVPTVLEM